MSDQWSYPDKGCNKGPALANDRAPWPIQWEQEVDDSCAHEWEAVALLAGRCRQRAEIVVRCAICCVPRCGHFVDENPCMERRHHTDLHIYLDGSWEPVGGILR